MRVGVENNDGREAIDVGSGIRWYAGVSPGVDITPSLPVEVGPKQGHEFEVRMDRSEVLRLDAARPICLTASGEDGTVAASKDFEWSALRDNLHLD
jgi:hypothetical protein